MNLLFLQTKRFSQYGGERELRPLSRFFTNRNTAWFNFVRLLNRNEPLTSNLSMKVSASMKNRLKQQENWQELVRDAIAKALEEK